VARVRGRVRFKFKVIVFRPMAKVRFGVRIKIRVSVNC
jgi:hypothetical protein